MSEQHANPTEENQGASPVKLAVIVFVGAIGLVFGIMLVAQFAIGTWALGAGDETSKSEAAIKERIGPLVTIAFDAAKGGVPAATPAALPVAAAAPMVAMAIPAAIPPAAAKASGGEAIYKTACSACHSAGVAGAPKSGDKAAWAPRIAQGKDTLYKHAVLGFQGKNGVMPAKGGNGSLSDADVKSAVDYMVALNK